MALRPNEPVAQRLLVVDDALLVAGRAETEISAAPQPELRFHALQFSETHAGVNFRYESGHPGFLRLAYSHAPFGHMELDGLGVPFSRDALGAVVVAAPNGSHRVSWRVGVSALRLRMLAFSGLTALLLLGIYIGQRRARARH